MIAVDTNVVVRYLTADDRAQAARAKRLLATQQIFVALTVLLETEWVLRGLYGFPRASVLAALRRFCGLPNVSVENSGVLERAISWADQGLDFADAVHVASSADCERFATFDSKLVRRGARVANLKVRAL